MANNHPEKGGYLFKTKEEDLNLKKERSVKNVLKTHFSGAVRASVMRERKHRNEVSGRILSSRPKKKIAVWRFFFFGIEQEGFEP